MNISPSTLIYHCWHHNIQYKQYKLLSNQLHIPPVNGAVFINYCIHYDNQLNTSEPRVQITKDSLVKSTLESIKH